MKTYLIVYYNSEGAPLTEVAERLMRMGFRPIEGPYDYEYEWNQKGALEDILEIGNQVHATLKGCKVLFKLETVPIDG